MSKWLNTPPTLVGFLFLMAVSVLLVDVVGRKRVNSSIGHYKLLAFKLSVATLILLLVWMIALYPSARQHFFNGHFIWDAVSATLGLGIIVLGLFALFYARIDSENRMIAFNDYLSLSLFSILGMLVLIFAGSMLSLFLGLELMSLPLYALVALERSPQQPRAEAAIKYIIMGAMASAILLYGFSFLYSMNHSLMLTGLFRQEILESTYYETSYLLTHIGIVFVIIAIAFKLGLVPFHAWVPEVYQSSPLSVGLLIGTLPKLALICMALRLMLDSFPQHAAQWEVLFLPLSLASILLGNLVALRQIHIKRLLAYSSIAHMGYVALGLVAKAPGNAVAIFYGFVYAFMTLNVFGVFAILNKGTGAEVERIEDLRGLSRRSPYLAFILALSLLSMAGIPPFIGFFSKLAVLQSVIEASYVKVACVALVISAIGAYYYLNIIKWMYFDEAEAPVSFSVDKTACSILGIQSVLLLGLSVFPSFFMNLSQTAVAEIPSLLLEISSDLP